MATQQNRNPIPVSLFHLIRERVSPQIIPIRCSKATLVHVSHTLEDVVLQRHLPAMILTGFQESSHWRKETERYRQLAGVARQVCIFAGKPLPPESDASSLHVTLAEGDPLRQEWFVAILSDEFSVVLCGQDNAEPAPLEATRQFETIWSFEPAIINSVLDVLEEAVVRYRPERLALLQETRATYTPANPDAALVTRFTLEMIRYEEALQRHLQEAEREHRRLLALLQAEHQKVDQLLTHLSVGVVLLDDQWKILVANDLADNYLNAIPGLYEADKLVTSPVWPLPALNEPDEPDLLHEIEVAGPPFRIFEVALRAVNLSPTLTGAILIIREVTEARAAQQRLRQQERLASIGQLAAGVAHDFNNILTSIIGFTELVRLDPYLSETSLHDLERVIQQSERAAKLVRQILDFSRRSPSFKQVVDLGDVVREIFGMLERTLGETTRCVLDLEAGPYPVEADVSQIQQALTNLALNAQDAMPEGGRLSLALRHLTVPPDQAPPCEQAEQTDWVVLTVADTGQGIAPADVPHIFEPFFTTKAVGQGSGLGLSQVFGIVQQHEGCIEVISQPGQGSAFTLYFPRQSAPEPAPPPAPSARPLARGQGETVLVVEDDVTTAKIFEAMLNNIGYQVLLAHDGQQGLITYQAQAGDIAVVLTDMAMPTLNGPALIEAIHRQDPAVKLIAVSGYPLEASFRQTWVETGHVTWLSKPVSLETLARTLHRLLYGETGEASSR